MLLNSNYILSIILLYVFLHIKMSVLEAQCSTLFAADEKSVPCSQKSTNSHPPAYSRCSNFEGVGKMNLDLNIEKNTFLILIPLFNGIVGTGNDSTKSAPRSQKPTNSHPSAYSRCSNFEGVGKMNLHLDLSTDKLPFYATVPVKYSNISSDPCGMVLKTPCHRREEIPRSEEIHKDQQELQYKLQRITQAMNQRRVYLAHRNPLTAILLHIHTVEL